VELKSTKLDSISIYDYAVAASDEHAYWFCVYKDSLPDNIIERQRNSTDTKTRQMAMSELSQSELLCVNSVLIGIEIIQDHTPQETLGYIADTFMDTDTMSLYALMRPYNTAKGRMLCKKIEFGYKHGCSLAHARSGEFIQVHELSLCTLGARPGTRYISTVLVNTLPRLSFYPRMFQQPLFLVAASVLQYTDGAQQNTNSNNGMNDVNTHIVSVPNTGQVKVHRSFPSLVDGSTQTKKRNIQCAVDHIAQYLC